MSPIFKSPVDVATTMSAMTTVAGDTLWQRLNGDCADQLPTEQCKELMGEQDICHDRLAISVCPESCGLCGAFEQNVCADTVLNNGCADLIIQEDVCNDKMAVFICPVTCNMCDELINSIITSLLEGTSNDTEIPASLLPPSVNPTDYPTFDCNELSTTSCGVLDGLCTNSFVGVVCPEHCKSCSAPITSNDATTMPPMPVTTPMAPVDTTNMNVVVTTMVDTTVMDTAVTDAATMMDTTMDIATGPTAPVCADHLNGMECSALPNVCGSVMALSVCPKYCGLC